MLQSFQHQYLLYFCCISGIKDVKQREAQPAVFLTTPEIFVLVKIQSICVLTNGGLSVERGNDTKNPTWFIFKAFMMLFHCSPHALVRMHTMTANGDETVAEIQRNCSNYTCDNYYSKARCPWDKRVLSKTTHKECTEKNQLLLRLC